MENPLLPAIVMGDVFFSFVSKFTYVAYIFLSLIFFTAFVFLLSTGYKKIRKNFPLKVNCWFCNTNATIPYDSYNAWDCPNCKQYNGFNKDGDYNKIIHEQFNLKLNKDIFTNVNTSDDYKVTSPQTNGLCKLCNINQQLKIQQLALFVPINENNYYEEIEQYREKLEKAYKLCSKCEKVLQDTLEKQEYDLLQNRLNSCKRTTVPQQSQILNIIGRNNVFFKNYGVLGLSIINIILGIFLFVAVIIHFETENHFLKYSLPNSSIFEPVLPLLEVILQWKHKIYAIKKELSFIGFIICFLAQLGNKFTKNNIILLSWGLVYIVLWSTVTGLQVLMSGCCIFLNIQAVLRKVRNPNEKSSPIKLGCSPVKKVFSEVNFSDFNRYTNKVPLPVLTNKDFTSMEENADFFTKKKRDSEEKLLNCSEGKKKNVRQKESEIESLPNGEKEKLEPSHLNSSNSSFTRMSFSPTSEISAKNGDLNLPLNEVFNTLNVLQLGGKSKKPNKPPNFLFANHTYKEGKSTSSIIKPAKLIKNLNSSSWIEASEGNSRSSTPSSGYSSQKPEKLESSRYDFPKTMSPISVNSFNRHSSNYFDYYDGTHGFYNMNSFSPGLAPFQFPGPLGHTTIYTSTRPTNFPLSFSPWHNYFPQKFSPTSPRFSDASDCDNLFQESSKKFGKNQRLSKIKSFFYHFSIFLNFVTFVSFMCFTSMGIILVDWKLPKFNFFA